MGISKIDGFNIYRNELVDSRFYFNTTTERDALPSAYRKEGLTTYCADTQKVYVLAGGILNSNWTEIGTGSVVDTIDANRPIKYAPEGLNLGATLTLGEFIEAAFYYDPPVINSFTGGTSLEKGEDTLVRTLSYNVSEPTGSYSISSIVITGTDGYNSGDIKTGSGNQSGTHNITLLSDTNTTYTITVSSTQSGVAVTSSTAFTFRNRIYWGVSPADSYNEAFIKSLGGNALDSDFVHAFTVNAGSGEYIYYAVPTAYVSSPYINPPYFYIGGFSGGFEVVATNISYTYEGNTENYTLYKSVTANLGNTSVSVQST